MIALIQRVKRAGVYIAEENYVSKIEQGYFILLGVSIEDDYTDVLYLSEKCLNLRIFNDENLKMNLSIKEIDGDILIVSQFTLYGSTIKGNRPNFMKAAQPQRAEELYDLFVEKIKENYNELKIKTGKFGAMMQVEIINDGPVTLIVESKK